MKLFSIFLTTLIVACTPAHAGYETGSADQVLRVPHAGGRPIYGQVDLSQSAAVTGALPPANGGTGITSSGTNGNVLTSNGSGWVSAVPAGSLPTVPSQQKFTSGSGTYGLSYYFIVSSASAVAGATYTNNSKTFTVTNSVISGTLILMTSTGAPASSGTLTKSSGTGDATITFSIAMPPKYIKITAVGGGAGGGGGGGSAGGDGTDGGDTTFGTSLIVASGGKHGNFTNGLGGAGGTCSLGSAMGIGIPGGSGGGAAYEASGINSTPQSGAGGNSILGGAGGGVSYDTIAAVAKPGNAGATNSGSGGSGGAGQPNNQYYASGGGAGCGIYATIGTPSSTYSYAVGASGPGGAAGSGGTPGAGGAGGAGLLVIDEYW